jgi:hypothetical protein
MQPPPPPPGHPPVAIVPYYLYSIVEKFPVQVIPSHRNAPPGRRTLRVLLQLRAQRPSAPPRGCRISSEMRHEKNPKDSSSQGWRKGGYHHYEKRISTEHFFKSQDTLVRYLTVLNRNPSGGTWISNRAPFPLSPDSRIVIPVIERISRTRKRPRPVSFP